MKKVAGIETYMHKCYENEIESKDKKISDLESEVCENISLNVAKGRQIIALQQEIETTARQNEIFKVKET